MEEGVPVVHPMPQWIPCCNNAMQCLTMKIERYMYFNFDCIPKPCLLRDRLHTPVFPLSSPDVRVIDFISDHSD